MHTQPTTNNALLTCSLRRRPPALLAIAACTLACMPGLAAPPPPGEAPLSPPAAGNGSPTGNTGDATTTPANEKQQWLDSLRSYFAAHARNLQSDGRMRDPAAAEYVATAGNDSAAALLAGFPQALAALNDDFAHALAAFDRGEFQQAGRAFEPLVEDADRYIGVNAAYFYARSHAALGHHELVASFLADAPARDHAWRAHTPFAAHLWFLLAHSQVATLDFESALQTLAELDARYPSLPEPVAVAMRQLRLELERRERGTLDEVATLMDYSANRLAIRNTSAPLPDRQEQIIALLDALIEDAEQQETQQQCGGQGEKPQGQPRPSGTPAQQSQLPAAGPQDAGSQHAAPEANPGEMWGKLPPNEREEILQSLRSRFPSRYRQLVEQYYRALAEED